MWTLGRPNKVTSFYATTQGLFLNWPDNTLGVFEFDRAFAMVDIAAMEPCPMARRFEIYGTKGSAILVEPFEPANAIRRPEEEVAATKKDST